MQSILGEHMKLGLVAASLILVAGGAVGCSDDGDGGDGGGDDATSAADFCGALKEFEADVSGVDPTADLPGYLQALKDAADKLDEVGTPEGMPEDAEEGFDLTIEKIGDLPDDSTLDDLSKMGDVSDAEQKQIDALDDYIAEECPELSEEDEPATSEPASPIPSPSE